MLLDTNDILKGTISMDREFTVDKLRVFQFSTRKEMGAVGAKYAAEKIRQVYEKNGEANLIFASSPSQMDVLTALLNEDVDWSRVNAFHMDEYVGVDIESPASFANYLRDNFFCKLDLKSVNYLNGAAPDIDAECRRYSELLIKHPVDITFAGIGENGHMAFNDPYLADFFDPKLVKINDKLDDTCRYQQVRDGWFETLEDVPDSAMTLTFPALLRAPHLIITCPSKTKSDIIQKVLEGPICLDVPSSVARLHLDAVLYIDDAAAEFLAK